MISSSKGSVALGKLCALFGDTLLVPSRRGMIATQRALELQAPLRSWLVAQEDRGFGQGRDKARRVDRG
ncbi:MAG TPA: hypothetical protein VIP05_20840, partial [Burkholderiaceae bacterium]